MAAKKYGFNRWFLVLPITICFLSLAYQVVYNGGFGRVVEIVSLLIVGIVISILGYLSIFKSNQQSSQDKIN